MRMYWDAILATFFTAEKATRCHPAAVVPLLPIVAGVRVLQVTAQEVFNHPVASVEVRPNLAGKSHDETARFSFCNVTVAYTHPTWGDEISLMVFLPLDGWNGRFLATGGGGWMTGPMQQDMVGAVSLGYAAAGTNGGHIQEDMSWALRKTAAGPMVNLPLLVDFASQSLSEMVKIGRPLAEAFFGDEHPRLTEYTYWAGCSTGGRQGLMMAQRNADLFDGILANAPAINWAQLLVSELWPQVVMHETATRPPACVLQAMTNASIAACDGLDGLVDGIVSAPGRCFFDPYKIVGKTLSAADCGGSPSTITAADAYLVTQMMLGPLPAIVETVNGSDTNTVHRLWYGLLAGTDFTALAMTTNCSSPSGCVALPFYAARDYVSYFLAKDPWLDTTALSYSQFEAFFDQSELEYGWIIGTNDADLRHLRTSNTKLLTFHGLSDELIFPNGSSAYYDRVLAADSRAFDYYRYFEAPGVLHCGGGIGPNPSNIFWALRDWVELGRAPSSLDGVTTAINGTVGHRPLCLYPHVAAYQGGDPGEFSSYICQVDF